MKKASKKDMNYDFKDQKAPKKPMGHGSYANMPEKAMIRDFPMQPEYRAGLINNYAHDIEEISEIPENYC